MSYDDLCYVVHSSSSAGSESSSSSSLSQLVMEMDRKKLK